MAKKINLNDVAAAAGVSVATVSRVANGSDSVSPDLREKVIKAAAQLGVDLYSKNRSKVITFLLGNRGVLHPFHSAVLVGAEAYCAEQGYGLLFRRLEYGLDVPWENLFIPQVLQDRDLVRGAIVAGTNSQNLLDLLSHLGIPFVVLGNNVIDPWKNEEYSAVYFDDIGGASAMTRYLQSQGHRRIWFVGNCRLPWFARRYQGYRAAMQERGLEPLLSEVESDNGDDTGYLASMSFLNRGENATAILAGDDATARGVYRAISDSGLNIPGDISVAGINDTADAAALTPPLTSVHVFTTQIGKQLAKVLMDRIADPTLAPIKMTLPTRLVKRESCGAPRNQEEFASV